MGYVLVCRMYLGMANECHSDKRALCFRECICPPAYQGLLGVHTLVVMAASLFQMTHEGTVSLGVDRAEVRDHMQ